NRNASFYPKAEVAAERAKQNAHPHRLEFPVATLAHKLSSLLGRRTMPAHGGGGAASVSSTAHHAHHAQHAHHRPGPGIAIKRREPVVAGQRHGPKVAAHLHASMNRFLRHADLGHKKSDPAAAGDMAGMGAM